MALNVVFGPIHRTGFTVGTSHSQELASIAADQLMSATTYYEVAARRLDAQLRSKESLDNKILGIFTAATAILLVAATVLSARVKGASWLLLLALLFAGATYCVLAWCVFQGYRTRILNYGVSVQELQQHLYKCTAAGLREAIGDNYGVAFDDNEPQMKAKARYLQLAMWGLLIETAFLLAAVGASMADQHATRTPRHRHIVLISSWTAAEQICLPEDERVSLSVAAPRLSSQSATAKRALSALAAGQTLSVARAEDSQAFRQPYRSTQKILLLGS
jgi:hypothetical protein